MAPATPAKDAAEVPPPVISAGGTYTLESISVGCKLFANHVDPKTNQITERFAEILSIREKKVSIYAPRTTAVKDDPADKLEYFVHWDLFNKRLDEWIPGSRLTLNKEMEWPRPKAAQLKKGGGHAKAPLSTPRPANTLLKRTLTRQSPIAAPSPTASLKRKTPHDEEEDEDAEGEVDMDVDPQKAAPIFSKEQEIEKLRTSGSMTQSAGEIARVKNLNKLQIGKHEVEAWYFSPYPVEYAHLPLLYICEFCLSFFPTAVMIGRHRARCNLHHPPGNEIYRDDTISFFEIDGRRQMAWCRNLSLLSKCFLDHKTLYYDVQPFLYYIMTTRDDRGCHIIGYFSKEKESAESYNVACILTLPQHQRHGYGKILIEFSYELSKREGKLGSPEKPLSDLGLLGYRAYWSEVIVGILLEAGNGEEVTIDEIAQKTSITHADVLWTCNQLQMVKHYKGQHVLVLSEPIMEQYEKATKKRRRRIQPDKLIWKPPVFSREQLRFGY